MSEKGIFISVLPKLELAALSSVVGQLKSIMGKAGVDAGKALTDPQLAGVKTLEDARTAAANRAAAAEIKAAKLSADAQIAEQKRVAAENARTMDVMTAAQASKLDALNAAAAATAAKSAQASKEAEQAGGKATAAADEHAAALAAATNATTKFGGAANVAGAAATGMFAVLGGIGVENAMKYERGLAGLQAQTDQSAASMKTLHDGLLALSPQVGRSLQDLVNASTMVAKSGPGFQDAAKNLQTVALAAQLASIEGAPLANTVKALTTTMNDFSFPASRMADVATMIKVAAGDAKVGIDEFAGSMHNIEPVFKSLVNGDASKAAPMFAQMAALVAGQTQNGTGGDQASENVRNTVFQLIKGLPKSRETYGALGGGSYEDLTKSLGDPNVGPVGALSHINDLITKSLTPEGQVHVSELYQSADAANSLKIMYDKLTPSQKLLADQINAGTAQYKDMKLAMKENVDGSDSMLSQWNKQRELVQGFDPLIKKYGGDLITLQQAWKDVTGSDAGYQVAVQNFGNPQAAAQIKQFVDGIKNAHAELDNGKPSVEGWAKVSQTLSVKLQETNASFQRMSTTMGEALLPAAKSFADIMTTIFNFLGNHKTILDGIIIALGGIATAWVGVKTAMILDTVWNGMEKGINLVIGKFGLLKAAALETTTAIETQGAAATKTATVVEGAATAEVTAEEGVTAAARTASISLGTVASTLATLAAPLLALNAFNDRYNSDHPNQPKDVRSRVGASALAEGATPLPPGWGGGDFGSPPSRGPHGGYGDTHKHPLGTGPDLSLATGDDSATGPLPSDYMGSGPASPDDKAAKDKAAKAPAGSSDDPFYIMPSDKATTSSGAKGTGADYNPLEEAASGGFTLPNIARMATTFLAELALGNPLGKLQAEKLGSSASNPMYVTNADGLGGNVVTKDQYQSIMADRRAQKAQDRYDAAASKYGPDSDQAQKAAKSLATAQEAQTHLGIDQAIKGTGSGSADAVASAIIQEGLKRGLNRDQIIAGLDVAKLESNYGQNPMSHVHQNQAGTDVEGIFQQDKGYSGNHDDPHNAAGQFFDRFIQRGGTNMNPYAGAVKVQVGTYGPGYVQGQNQGGVYDRLAPGLMGGYGPQAASAPGAGLPLGAFGPIGGGRSPVLIGNGPGRTDNGPHGGLGDQMRQSMGGTSAKDQSGQLGTTNKSSGFGVGGGIIGAAESAAQFGMGGGGGGAAGGAGGAAAGAGGDILSAEANRFAGYIGQLGGIAAEGLLETFSLNDSSLSDPSKSLPGKIIFGLAGAHSNAPNTAGQTQPPLKPKEDDKNKQGQGQGGDVNQTGIHVAGDLNINGGGQDAADEIRRSQNQGMMALWGGNPPT